MKIFLVIFIPLLLLALIFRMDIDSQINTKERKLEGAYKTIDILEAEIEKLQEENEDKEDCLNQLNRAIDRAMGEMSAGYINDAYDYLYDTRSCR